MTEPNPPRDTENRCPKCKSRSFKVTVTDLVQMTNEIVDGRWASAFDESAMPARQAAYGNCTKCKHSWKFRSGYID